LSPPRHSQLPFAFRLFSPSLCFFVEIPPRFGLFGTFTTCFSLCAPCSAEFFHKSLFLQYLPFPGHCSRPPSPVDSPGPTRASSQSFFVDPSLPSSFDKRTAISVARTDFHPGRCPDVSPLLFSSLPAWSSPKLRFPYLIQIFSGSTSLLSPCSPLSFPFSHFVEGRFRL